MSWDDFKTEGDELTAEEWNDMVDHQLNEAGGAIVSEDEPDGEEGDIWIRPNKIAEKPFEWKIEMNGRWEAIAADIENNIVFGGEDFGADDVFAIDVDDGSIIWQHSFHTDDIDGVAYDSTNNRVYSYSSDDTIYAVDANDGSEEWNESVDIGTGNNGMDYDSTNNVVYHPEGDTLVARDADNGSESWSVTEVDDDINSIRYDENENVVYASDEDLLVAHDASDNGSVLWDIELSSITNNGVEYDETSIYVLGAVNIHKLDKSGNIIEQESAFAIENYRSLSIDRENDVLYCTVDVGDRFRIMMVDTINLSTIGFITSTSIMYATISFDDKHVISTIDELVAATYTRNNVVSRFKVGDNWIQS